MDQEESAILAVLDALAAAISRDDEAAMHELLVPGGGATHSRRDRVFHMRLGDEPARWVAARPSAIRSRIQVMTRSSAVPWRGAPALVGSVSLIGSRPGL